jgi:hypothetical protein
MRFTPRFALLRLSSFLVLPACDGCTPVGCCCSSMLADYQLIDECKEGDGGALLRLHERSDAAAADSPLPIADGQMQISYRAYHRLPPNRTLIDAPVCALYCYAGAPLAFSCARARVDSAGEPACELCGRRLRTVKGKLYKHENGRICQRCHDITRRPHHAPSGTLTPPRIKRPYDSLGPTQKWKRRQLLRSAIAEAEQRVGCALTTVQPQPTPSPAELIHLPTSVREQIRSVPSLHIPSEQTMIACKKQLAATHATETGTFAGGAYITDPLAYVSVLCAQSPFIAVGGDAGGGRCAIGITYSHQSVQHFAALLVYEGSDSWIELQDCRAEGLTPFVGDSVAFPHIWAVLQHLIDTRGAFLNGDCASSTLSSVSWHPLPLIRVPSASSHTRTFSTPLVIALLQTDTPSIAHTRLSSLFRPSASCRLLSTCSSASAIASFWMHSASCWAKSASRQR